MVNVDCHRRSPVIARFHYHQCNLRNLSKLLYYCFDHNLHINVASVPQCFQNGGSCTSISSRPLSSLDTNFGRYELATSCAIRLPRLWYSQMSVS